MWAIAMVAETGAQSRGDAGSQLHMGSALTAPSLAVPPPPPPPPPPRPHPLHPAEGSNAALIVGGIFIGIGLAVALAVLARYARKHYLFTSRGAQLADADAMSHERVCQRLIRP